MARNRRRVEGEVTFSWVATRLLLFMLLVGFGLGILFLKNRNYKLGDELGALDRDLKQFTEETNNLQAQLARMQTPRELEAKLARWQLGMAPPVDGQIRCLREPDSTPVVASQGRMLVQAGPTRPISRTP